MDRLHLLLWTDCSGEVELMEAEITSSMIWPLQGIRVTIKSSLLFQDDVQSTAMGVEEPVSPMGMATRANKFRQKLFAFYSWWCLFSKGTRDD